MQDPMPASTASDSEKLNVARNPRMKTTMMAVVTPALAESRKTEVALAASSDDGVTSDAEPGLDRLDLSDTYRCHRCLRLNSSCAVSGFGTLKTATVPAKPLLPLEELQKYFGSGVN